MGERFRTRRLEPDEWRRFRDIRLRSLKDSPEAFGGTFEGERDSDEVRWRGWLTGDGWQGDVGAFLAEDDVTGGSIGVAVCALFDAEPGTAHLFAMWVDPAARNRGVGRALVRAVVARAKERQAHGLMLCVTVGNDAAAALYSSCGFVGTADPPRPLREGSGLSIVDMRLPLDDVGRGIS
jgi:ribosomal protein S18 acetylase RimI-like enzyme